MMSMDVAPESTRCAECGHPGDLSSTIPALDGQGRRCADDERCHDRKEARSAFTTAA
jgi:hypothetical protein